jgi:H+/Cl- antiporter ClcA
VHRPNFFDGSDVNGPSATRPSLSIGAGIGDLLRTVFPDYSPGAIVLLGMVAYFTGVL